MDNEFQKDPFLLNGEGLLPFGMALYVAKDGHGVTRAKWNDTRIMVVYQKGYPKGIACNTQTAKVWGINEGDLFKCEPYLQISTIDGSHKMWVPTVEDCLAEDWYILK